MKTCVLNTTITKSDSSEESDKVEIESEDDTESKISSSNGSNTLAPLTVTPRICTQAVNMAGGVQKFIAPSIFSAKPEVDAMDWLERFELAASYNRWTDADQARNFVMYL